MQEFLCTPPLVKSISLAHIPSDAVEQPQTHVKGLHYTIYRHTSVSRHGASPPPCLPCSKDETCPSAPRPCQSAELPPPTPLPAHSHLTGSFSCSERGGERRREKDSQFYVFCALQSLAIVRGYVGWPVPSSTYLLKTRKCRPRYCCNNSLRQ